MLIGLDAYGDTESCAFQTYNVVKNFYRLTLGKAVVDEIFATQLTDNLLNTNRENWSYLTVLRGEFQNTLEAGNLQNQGVPIESLQLRKRRVDSLAWTDIVLFPFSIDQSIYEFTDRIVRASEVYEYMVVPLTSGIFGSSITEQIECEFSDTFVCDKNTSYKLFCNLEYGDIQNVLPSTVVQTFQKHPTVLYGQPEYQQGSVKALVLTDSTINTGVVDKRQERLNREQMMAFFKNRKPKVLKDSAGRYYMIAIVGNPTESPNNQLNQSISDISFEWVQIGDITALEAWEV